MRNAIGSGFSRPQRQAARADRGREKAAGLLHLGYNGNAILIARGNQRDQHALA
jgi:hypothetical protein